jgi:hypothetical protein
VRLALLLLLILLPAAREEEPALSERSESKGAAERRMRGLILVGEAVIFTNGVPQFSGEQVRRVSKATREGLALWAATDHGRNLIERFNRDDYQIFVVEDGDERGLGRAPQPAIGTMISGGDRSRLKVYRLVLNPAFAEVPQVGTPLFDEPRTPAERMAAAWAGEMLHIDFYSQGIVLPHHGRSDFRREWQNIATQLGFPTLEHDDDR